MNNFKCPHCGKSHYRCEYGMTTAMYYPPVYKDGVNVNPDGNTTTYQCKCVECGTEFSVRVRYGEVIDTRITKSVEEIAKEKEELEKRSQEYTLTTGTACEPTNFTIDSGLIFKQDPRHRFIISDSVKDIVVQYKEKEYTFNIEKVLDILCKEVK